MAKIQHDKYYTPIHIVNLVMERVNSVIGLNNITEFIEPSAGDGAFLDSLYSTKIPTIAYDLYPERNDIIKQDYLELDLEYKKGRCIIGNPPFGDRNLLLWKFYRKAIHQADYIVFILPISQFNNDQQLFEFDLIYSENIGIQAYSNKNINCCLNIYKKPDNGINSKKNNYKLKDIEIKENRLSRNQYIPKDYDYDIGICVWGDVGKVLQKEQEYAQEAYIKCNNYILKDKVIEVIKNANWKNIYPMSASPTLKQWQIYKYLKQQIPELG